MKNKNQQVPLTIYKQSFNSISLSFRKLLDRVASAEIRSASYSNSKKYSVGQLYLDQFQKQRKSSLRNTVRKNSYFSHNISMNSKRPKTEMDKNENWRVKSSNGFNLSSSKYRSKSNPSFSNCNQIYSKINEYNGLLITKCFQFDQDTTPPQKRSLKSPFRKHNSTFSQKRQSRLFIDQSKPYQSKIKGNEKRRKMQLKYKNFHQYNSKKKFLKIGDFQPWQTQKGEEYCFIDE